MTCAHRGETLRGVEVAGTDVSGLGADDLTTAVAEIAQRLDDRAVTVTAAGRTFSFTAGEVGHVMAHELRGPLNNIGLKAQMIYRLSQRQNAHDKVGECAAAIIKQVAISGEFLGYLQTMAPAQSVTRDPEPVPLYEVIEQVLGDSHVRLTQTQTTVHIPSDLPTVWGYRVPLIHILQNLIDNSIKYRRPEQGCTITISAETRKDRVLLAIQDNGRGIPTTERGLVFEPARRASNVGQTPGHGLGLAFCQKLMTAMGGSIRHAPTASEGARFELWFRTDKGRGKRASVLDLQK